MNNEIMNLISQYETSGDFTYEPLPIETKAEIEAKLGISLDNSFMDFLTKYGHGGICGVEVLGIGKNKKPMFLEATLQYREYGLPVNLLVIERCDEWVYCLDCNDGKIVTWADGESQFAWAQFDDYILNRFQDAIENSQ